MNLFRKKPQGIEFQTQMQRFYELKNKNKSKNDQDLD